MREANRELHREIEQRTRAEESLKERVRVSTLNAEVAVALSAGVELQPMLQRCCELVVQHLDVAFARIWLLNAGTQTLEMQSGADCYTHLDGRHCRVKVGQSKIGLIAQNKQPVLTNNVQSDPRVSDHQWATREGMVAFAGYPLMIEDRVLGVLAMFARRPLSDDLLNTLGSIADSLSLGIERKRAQMAHTESEARFSAAFQASTVCMTISRMDDRKFLLANEAFLKWTGYRLDEVVGHDSQALGIWADPAERDRLWEELRRTRSIRERECRMRNRHGKLFIMLISCDAIEIQGATHLLTVGLDITERKRAEAALAEGEARFSAAFNFSPIMTGITRASDGRFVLVNDAALTWIGCSREEVLGHTSVELGLWEDPAERKRFWEHLQISGSTTQPWECRLKNRHGKRSTMLASGVRIEISGEEHLLVMMVDITERKKAETELQASEVRLRESETRFSVAFQASPVLISLMRMSDEKYVLANDALLNWVGYPREEVLGRTSGELSMWVDPAERQAVWQDLRRTGSIRQRECRWRDRRGELFTILLSAESISIDNSPHVLSMALNITQRKRAEEELLRTLAREKELSQLKSNFVSMVSHEFRTPLGIIQSSAELLHDFFPKMQPEDRDGHLESIARNTRRMAGMMEEILILSRLDAGKLDFQPARLDLNLFCRRLVDEVQSATNRRCPIELSLISVPPDAHADERLLGHIFTNLLSNAVKYSEPSGTVLFTVARDGCDAVCRIQDQGLGIPDNDLPRLFDAFHRGSNVGSRPGTGLGLLVVKRCAELHRGKVQIESKIGAGTTATFRFPAFITNT